MSKATERVVIVGAPRTGKSTLAAGLGSMGVPVYCGDPRSLVKEPRPRVTYLPEGIPLAAERGARGVAADWIAEHWFTLPGPWVMEGQVMARALRRWMENGTSWSGLVNGVMPCDRVIFMLTPKVRQIEGQRTMGKGIETVWYGNDDKPGIEPYYRAITEYRV